MAIGWPLTLEDYSFKFRHYKSIVRQLVRQLVYTMFVSNNRTSFHLWWKENLLKHQGIEKSQNIMKVVVAIRG